MEIRGAQNSTTLVVSVVAVVAVAVAAVAVAVAVAAVAAVAVAVAVAVAAVADLAAVAGAAVVAAAARVAAAVAGLAVVAVVAAAVVVVAVVAAVAAVRRAMTARELKPMGHPAARHQLILGVVALRAGADRAAGVCVAVRRRVAAWLAVARLAGGFRCNHGRQFVRRDQLSCRAL
jgi:hypothetical protein